MSSTTPTALDPRSLPERVLVVVARGEDLARGSGALVEALADRGADVRVLVLTGEAVPGDRASACARLPRGDVGARFDLVQLVRAEIARGDARLVLAPTPLEPDPDRRAAGRAACAAADDGAGRRLLLYSIEAPMGGARFGAESYADLDASAAVAWSKAELERELGPVPRTTAVVSTWNKKDDVAANLDALRAQTLPFAEIVVVDNASRDGTAEFLRARFPEVRVIAMPHDRFGACATFNLGFKASRTELTAILDDDIVMPPDWLAKATARMQREPKTTAIVSTQVTEPGMPEGYRASPRHNTERYMSTFRGCASLARAHALAEAEYYDERLFIYGNERDLTCRLLNRGYRVLQYPGCGVFHKTPFGIKMGKRSLYYHARNAWISMLKYAPLADLARMPWLVFARVLLRGSAKEAAGEVTDATGTIGIGKSLRETPGAWWTVTKAAFSVLANVPYCLRRRAPCRAPDFELPLK
ncbi:MAG: glycosyltransferase [Planctomycetes bacterium]|nr:glycosyltransferase [Planctomycetota bacterium]